MAISEFRKCHSALETSKKVEKRETDRRNEGGKRRNEGEKRRNGKKEVKKKGNRRKERKSLEKRPAPLSRLWHVIQIPAAHQRAGHTG